MPDEPSVAGRHETASAPAPRFTSLEGGPTCPGCVLRDHQIDLLSRSLGVQAEAAQILSARLRASESELGRRVAAERAGAAMLLGLAGLQKAPGA